MIKPLVSLVVVNHNGGSRLEKLVYSIMQSTYADFEIIIVDNGSSDDSANNVQKNSHIGPRLKVLVLERNEPLTVAANLGIRAGSGQIIGLVHNDVVVSSNWLDECMKTIMRSDTIAAVQGKIFRFESSEILDSCGCIVDWHACEHDRGDNEVDNGQYDVECQIFSASGVASLFRKDAISRVGLFDESYESGLDDVDLCWRLRLMGYDVVYAPRAIAHHMRGATWKSSRSLRRKVVLEFAKTRLYVPFKNLEVASFFANLPLILLHFVGGVSLNLSRPGNSTAYLEASVWFMRNLPDLCKQRALVQGTVRRMPDRILFENAAPGCNLVRYFIAPKLSSLLRIRR